MSSLKLVGDSYINIGNATLWRETLLNHATTIYFKTASQCPSCLVSLSNGSYEAFTLNVNTTRRGKYASGLSVALQDIDGNVLKAHTDVPCLADNRWHLVEVEIKDREVAFRVDGKFVTAIFTARPRMMTSFVSAESLERPVYPSNDLIGGINKHGHIVSYFVGKLSDISVCKGGLCGPRTHWWIVDGTDGSTVWDRGYFSLVPPGMHLHCCNCQWDPVDHPAPALFCKGIAGFYSCAPLMSRMFFDEKIGVRNEDDIVPTVKPDGTAGLSGPHQFGVRVQVSISFWLKSQAKGPAVVASVPLSGNNIFVVLNDEGSYGIALLIGNKRYTANVDLCDNEWRHVRWVVDPFAGISFFLNDVRSSINVQNEVSSPISDEKVLGWLSRVNRKSFFPVASLEDDEPNAEGNLADEYRHFLATIDWQESSVMYRSRRSTSGIDSPPKKNVGAAKLNDCFQIGRCFCGFLRELKLQLGTRSYSWSLTQGRGNAVPCLYCNRENRVEFGLEVRGRYPLWPKASHFPRSTLWMHGGASCIEIGTFNFPLGEMLDLSFFVQLASVRHKRCELLSVEGTVALDCCLERVIIALPDASNSAIALFAASSILLEDSQWHCIQLRIPSLGNPTGFRLTIDSTPIDTLPLQAAMPLSPPALATPGPPSSISPCSSQEVLSGVTGAEMSSSYERIPSAIDMKTPHSGRQSASIRLDPTAAASQLSLLVGSLRPPKQRISVGGAGFHGSIALVTAANGSERVHWSLDEGYGMNFAVWPPVECKVQQAETVKSSSMPSTASSPKLNPTLNAEWHPTTFPPMTLHMDGTNSCVEALGFNSVFSLSSMSRFSAVLWLKYSVGCSRKACLFSIHDRTAPSLDASAGIFVHTRVVPNTSPKKRFQCTNATTFMLCDSAERCLALEIVCERLYDGLWHKIEWSVLDSTSNSSQVRIDDRVVDAVRVCEECPRDFNKWNASGEKSDFSETMTLNIGARDEGDQGVTDFFSGDIRGFRLYDQGVTIVDWAMDEGRGSVLYDTKDPPVVGHVSHGTWELTTFPPRTPVFARKSTIEIEPMRDVEDEFTKSGEITFAGTIRAPTSASGVVFVVLSTHRHVIASFTLNEGGDDIPRQEAGTHTFRVAVPHAETAPCVLPQAGRVQCSRSTHRGRRQSMRRRRGVSLTNPFEDVPNRAVEVPLNVPRDVTPSTDTCITRTKSVTDAVVTLRVDDTLSSDAAAAAFRGGAASSFDSRGSNIFAASEVLVDIVAFQIHHDELTDGSWHELEWHLTTDPTNSSIFIDGQKIPILLFSRTPTTWRIDAVDSSFNSDSLRPLGWGSFVVGRIPTSNAFCGSIENVLIQKADGAQMVYVPLAGSTLIHSESRRRIAASNISWELSIPPVSCLYLGGEQYIAVPALPSLKPDRFEFSCKIRTADKAHVACLVDIGHESVGIIRLMVNENAQSQYEPCVVHGSLIDVEGLSLEVDCIAQGLFDHEWHTFAMRVRNSAENDVAFMVDGRELIVRYGACCAPRHFPSTFDEGGSIGALVENLVPRSVFRGMIQRAVLSDSMDGTVHACWELTKGYGILLADSSGNRNHAIAVNALWRTCTTSDTVPLRVPKSAFDIAPSAKCTVSRWSNNPDDICLRDEVTREVFVSEWPANGWLSGAPPPQWCSFELDSCCTLFQVVVTLDRATPSTHEIWLSRTPPSALKSSENFSSHVVTLAERISIKSASSRVLRTSFSYPYYNIRFVRIVTSSGSLPVSYQSVVIYCTKAPWRPPRGRVSFMQAAPHSRADVTLEAPSTLFDAAIEEVDEAPKIKTAAEKERERRRLFYTVDVERVGYITPEEFTAVYSTIDIFQTPKDKILDAVCQVVGDDDRITYDQFCILLSRLERWWGRAGELRMYGDQREGYTSDRPQSRQSFVASKWSQDLV